MADMPQAGQPAPPFSGTTYTGDTVALSDFAGQPVALYFYPKDDTPGCTKQACNLRDNYAALQHAGIAIVGVSADDEASHGRFTEKYDLPFPLIADTERAIMEAYGAYGEKNMYGVKRMGVKRTTFLVDGDGTIVHVFKRPKTAAHAEEILAKWEAAQA